VCRPVLEGLRGVRLKNLLCVSRAMSETPSPVSSSIRRLVPFSSTGISMPFVSVIRLYKEIENGSTEEGLASEASGSSTL